MSSDVQGRRARYTHGRQSLGVSNPEAIKKIVLRVHSDAHGHGCKTTRTGCWSGGWCSFGGFSLPTGRKLWRTRTVGACIRTADFHCLVKPFFLDRVWRKWHRRGNAKRNESRTDAFGFFPFRVPTQSLWARQQDTALGNLPGHLSSLNGPTGAT